MSTFKNIFVEMEFAVIGLHDTFQMKISSYSYLL